MAIIKCKECGREISSKAKTCPGCGYKNKKKTSKLTWVILIIIICSLARIGNSPTAISNTSNKTSVAAIPTSIQTSTPTKNTWQYNTEQDEMGRGTIKTASLISENQVEFSFPYSGAQNAILILRSHPKYGKDVMLSIDKGQFLCGIDECNISVKFGDSKAEVFSAGEPSDNRTTTLFIRGFDRFLSKAKKSKTIKIEAQFYQEGNRVFEFNSEGLNW